MKHYLLIFFAFSFIYFVFEAAYNRITGRRMEPHLDKPLGALVGYCSVWMLLFGGVCAVLIQVTHQYIFHNSMLLTMLAGCIIVTVLEFLGGYVLNIVFKLRIWDYTDSYFVVQGKKIRLNVMGQIDLFHSVGWFFLSGAVCKINDFIIWMAS